MLTINILRSSRMLQYSENNSIFGRSKLLDSAEARVRRQIFINKPQTTFNLKGFGLGVDFSF